MVLIVMLKKDKAEEGRIMRSPWSCGRSTGECTYGKLWIVAVCRWSRERR